MKRRTFLLTALLTACSATPTAKYVDLDGDGSQHVKPTYPAPKTTAGDVASVVESTNRFAAAMYEQLRTEPGNMAFSPASIGLALNMTRAGSRGETAAQMAATLKIDIDDDRAHAAYGSLLHGWNYGERPYTLVVASRLFGEKTMMFKQPFTDITRGQYGAALEPLSFKTAPDASRVTINAWVEKQTHERITDLLPANSVSNATRLVLTNAIYFKGKWKEAFDKKHTRAATFYASTGETQVPTMHLTSTFNYVQADGMRMVEIPYKGDALSMTIIVPDAKDGVAQIEKKLTHENLQRWLSSSAEREVILSLPRFKIDPVEGVALKPMLTQMGMVDAFDGKRADLSGIADVPPNEKLYISDAYHKAFIEVNEEGTEAAAATAVVVDVATSAADNAYVSADRPFLFLIRDTATGAILFMGRINNPASR